MMEADARPSAERGPTAAALLHALVEHLPVALCVVDLELRIILVNERAAAYVGLPRAAHPGRYLGELVPELAGSVVPALERVRDGGEPVRDLEIAVGPRGAEPERRFLLDCFPVRGWDGGIEALAAVAREITNERGLERALRERVEELERLLDLVPVAIFQAHDPEGRRITGNRAAAELIRMPAGANLSLTAPAGERQAWYRVFEAGRELMGDDLPLQAAARGQELRDREHEVRLADGTTKRIYGYATPLRGPDGAVRGSLAAFLDITALKHAEARLAEASRRHEDLFSLAHDAVLVWRLDGGIESWNRGAEELYGFSEAEAREQQPQSLLRTAAPVPWSEVEAALRGPGQWTGELVHRTRDGRPLTVVAKLQRFHGADGLERVLEVVRDVTEQRRVQAELASVARFPEESPDPVFRVTRDHLVSHANPAALEQLAPLRLVRGRPAPPAIARLAARAGELGGRLRGEVESGERTYELSLVAAGGEVNVYGRDVTDRRRAEEILRSEGERRAEFLAILSHELRNPLAPIENSLALLDRAPGASAAAERARGALRRQVGHLARLVDDLLDLTRVSHGKIVLRRTRLDAREAVAGACDDLRGAAEARGLALRVAVPDGPVWIDADPTRIAQVVGNLVTNATKFTPPNGRVEVTLSAGEGECTLRVRDDGDGIAPEDLERIFEPFAQADRTRGASPGGVGLGLALVKSLVALHGGAVRAESDGPGHGAQLTVTLPLAHAPAAEAGAPAPAEGAPVPPLSIVVVDDNVDAAETLAALLSLDGHTARVAADGRAGIAACEDAPPDVLVCDIGLPDVDGYEVVRAVRRRCGPGVFAVALTGYAQGEDLARAREAGFDAHVAKPPSFEALRALLARARR